MLRSSSLSRFVLGPALVAALTGCGSTPAASGDAGGPVPDADDQHCMVNGQLAPAKVGLCVNPAGGDDGGAADAAANDASTATTDFGDTLYNSSGYDDDCKYSVSFTSTPVRQNAAVTFTVTVAGLDPAGPSRGANVYAEVYLTPSHPSPSIIPNADETSPGVYTVGPIVFDAPGLWTVRFHFYEMCSDAPADSPHGHAAFYIQVP